MLYWGARAGSEGGGESGEDFKQQMHTELAVFKILSGRSLQSKVTETENILTLESDGPGVTPGSAIYLLCNLGDICLAGFWGGLANMCKSP